MLKVWTAYRFADALSVEAAIGQVQGTFSGTEFWNINLNVEPWSDRRLSPFFGVGLGSFKNIPNASLVSATVTNANLANAAIGLRYYIAERFVARLDYSIYTAYVSDSGSAEYRAWTLGMHLLLTATPTMRKLLLALPLTAARDRDTVVAQTTPAPPRRRVRRTNR